MASLTDRKHVVRTVSAYCSFDWEDEADLREKLVLLWVVSRNIITFEDFCGLIRAGRSPQGERILETLKLNVIAWLKMYLMNQLIEVLIASEKITEMSRSLAVLDPPTVHVLGQIVPDGAVCVAHEVSLLDSFTGE